MGVSFSPKTGMQPIQPKIRDKKGRKCRPLIVFPGDSRHILFDTSWPWVLSGKIINSDGKWGSGVLIGDRLVLTARHVLPWNSISNGNWWMKFTPHYFDGTENFGFNQALIYSSLLVPTFDKTIESSLCEILSYAIFSCFQVFTYSSDYIDSDGSCISTDEEEEILEPVRF